jgi:hypothetical protein
MKSRFRRAITSLGVASVIAVMLVGVGPARAHPGQPDEPGEDHAVQDLAGVAMDKIEKDTRANAAKTKERTG